MTAGGKSYTPTNDTRMENQNKDENKRLSAFIWNTDMFTNNEFEVKLCLNHHVSSETFRGDKDFCQIIPNCDSFNLQNIARGVMKQFL